MEVDDDYIYEDQTMEELGVVSMDEEETLVGSDDLVEYSAGEEEIEEETVYIKTEESFEETIPKTMITSPNITVKRVINNKPVITPTNLTSKLAPKTANFVRATNAAGKVVFIQKPSTTTGPVKLLNNAKSPPATSTTSYHLVKSESGVVMQPKLPTPTMIRRVVPATSTSSTAASSGLNKPKMIAKPSTHVVIHTKMGPSGTTTTKTLTVAEAHQMGLLNNKVKQVVQVSKPKPPGIPSTNKSPNKVLLGASTSNSTIVRLKQSPVVTGATSAGQVQRVQAVAKSAGYQSQKVVLPHSAIQAGQQSGQIQAINIPGKGIQYVRFLNQTGNSTSLSNSEHKVVKVMNKVNPSSGSKIIVQNNKTYVVSNGNVTAMRTTSAQSSNQNRVLASGSQSVVRNVLSASSSQSSIVRRPPETTRYIAVVHKDDDTSSEMVTRLTTSQLSQLSGTTVMSGGSKTKIVMIPSSSGGVSGQMKTALSGSSSSSFNSNPSLISVKRESVSGSEDETRRGPAVGTIFPDEAYKKRPCNCTKSQCLKLYCDCFANGEFCYNCNCRDCYNNLENEEERQKAIRATLERNPSAFKPKIGAVSADEDALRLHTKGCNCKRSGCLKNYCECYEAKIVCSANCKCIGCRNTEQYAKEYEYATSLAGVDSVGGVVTGEANLEHLSGEDSMAEVSQTETSFGGPSGDIKPIVIGAGTGAFVETKPMISAAAVATVADLKRSNPAEPDLTQLPPSKQPYNFMTPDVIEATVQCMIAQADECQKRGCNIRTAERMILEEFGRCLVEIIEFSSKSDS